MTLAQYNREQIAIEQQLKENAKRYRDSQIGMRYMYCPKCNTECRWSQYGRDDQCPKCKEWIDWSENEK